MSKYRLRRKYGVALLRERLSEALDSAERGDDVLIERRGVTYRLTVERPAARTKKQARTIEILDPAVNSGEWTWAWSDGQLQFAPRARS